MENLEQRKAVIELGKLIVKELGLERDVDTLARWMAHYLAEKILQAESCPQEDKAKVERECCDLILRIWDHRSQMPHGSRPFESFEPILKVLESINPDNEDPFLHRISKRELSQLEATNPNYQGIKPYLEGIVEIEKASRIWIENFLNQAARKVTDERTKEWLYTASLISSPNDVRSIRIMLEDFNPFRKENNTSSSSQDTERLTMRIQQLEKFGKLNELLLKTYQDELIRDQQASSG